MVEKYIWRLKAYVVYNDIDGQYNKISMTEIKQIHLRALYFVIGYFEAKYFFLL